MGDERHACDSAKIKSLTNINAESTFYFFPSLISCMKQSGRYIV